LYEIETDEGFSLEDLMQALWGCAPSGTDTRRVI
jgi:hypothetical protein